jgi:uncharacterized protein YecE (DUF72 family)
MATADSATPARETPGGGLHIGTSGWHYASWIGPFYPAKLAKPKLLAFYADQFDTAEINLSFYRLPTEAALATWRDTTPEGFVFAWKAHRIVTHYRRLRNVDADIPHIFGRMALLGAKDGPVLFQLHPRLTFDRERLAALLALLPPGRRYTFEFRHRSWYEPGIMALLAGYNASLCLSDHAAAPAPPEATADFVYVRLHGPSGRYHGSYPDEALALWASRIRAWRAEGRTVFCYFDNDIKAAAPADAARLKAMLAGSEGAKS